MTIRSSMYFSFDNIDSRSFGIANVNIGNGMLEEPFTASRSIKEIKIAGNPNPYFQSVEYEPLEFDVSFAFLNKFDRDKLREISRWLIKDTYKELTFSDEPNRIFYAMFTGSSDLIHTGADEGYIKLHVRCNSPFSYSSIYTDSVIDLSSNSVGGAIVELENLGDEICKPEVSITKIGNGNVSIFNISNNNQEFKFTSLLNNEEIYVNNERQQIKSNLEDRYGYDNFNNNYIELLSKSINQLKIVGNCKVQFRYQFKFSQ